MNYFLYALSGVLGGLLGGMGMGGGTVLIPILTIFFNINQYFAQMLNLISFIPMSIISVLIHLKNKLIKFDKYLIIVFFGLISTFVFSFVAKKINSDILGRIFGGFLIILSVIQFITAIRNKKQKIKKKSLK